MSRQAPIQAFMACLLPIVLGTALLAQTPPPKTPPAKPPVTTKPTAAPAKAAPASGPAKVIPAPEPPASDVKVHTRYTRGAEVSENATYIHGPRQRVEFPGVVTLDQCDMDRTVLLNDASKKYLIRPYNEVRAKPPAAPATPPPADMDAMASLGMMGRGAQPQPARGGVITYTATLADTLERKPLFGREARRIKTVIVKQPSASACDKSGLKVEVDGWYVDLPESAGCAKRDAAPDGPSASSPDACVDRAESQTIGDAKLGFPVAMVTTTTIGEGDKQEVSSTSMEVTALEVTRLDAALFTVPPTFVEANSSAELLPTLAAGGSLAETLFGSTADGTSAAAPRKPGIIRVGVLEVANKTPRTLAARQLREHLVGEFRKAPFEALPLAGSAAGDIQQDAARLGCDYILLTEVTDIKTSKPGKVTGLLKRTAGEDATRDIHDVKLDYKILPVGGAAATALSGSSKATSGGVSIGTALKVATLAGQMYLSMYGMGGMGMGMMNPLMSIPGLGGAAGPFAASGLFDPRMKAMSSMTRMVSAGGMSGLGAMAGAPGGGGDSDAALTQTVGTALDRAAKSTMEQLQTRKK